MQSTPELPATPAFARIDDIVADVVRLREKVQVVKDMRFCYLALGTIVSCVAIFAFGHSDPDFYNAGGFGAWMALTWAFVAIGDVFVSHYQAKLAWAMLAQGVLARRRDCSGGL